MRIDSEEESSNGFLKVLNLPLIRSMELSDNLLILQEYKIVCSLVNFDKETETVKHDLSLCSHSVILGLFCIHSSSTDVNDAPIWSADRAVNCEETAGTVGFDSEGFV